MTVAGRAAERVVAVAARRPGRTLALLAVLTALGAGLALGLEPSAATGALASRSSETWQATERQRERFGDHAVVVLARGPLPQLVLTENLGRLLGLEGCLAARPPRGAAVPGGPRGPCAELARMRAVRVVYGPGTFVNAAVGEIQQGLRDRLDAKAREAARAARAARALARRQGRSRREQARLARSAEQLVYAQFVRDLLALNLRYGLGVDETPRLDDPDFVSALVFDPSRGASVPKARFAHLFPSASSALIQVKLEPGLSDAQRERATALVRAAVAMPQWKLRNAAGYTVTGVPVLAEDLADALAGSVARLLIVAVVVMALVLALVFRRPRRLVPLGVALAAAAITFGLSRLAGAPLTMASVAALPVLLGLGVDYAIQYQARVQELGSARAAARRALPAVATAALATVAGLAVLLLSPIPLVRGFGVLLIAGLAVALACALTGGTAALALHGRRRAAAGPPATADTVNPAAAAGSGGPLARAARGADELLAAGVRPLGALRRPAAALLELTLRRPGRVLVVALALAAAGWALDTRAEVVSDLPRLVPQDLPALRNLETLQAATGVAGEVDVVVEGRDLTAPATLEWMRRYQASVLARERFTEENGCGRAALCPALSLIDLFGVDGTGDGRALLASVPPYFSRGVITADRRTANLAFGLRLMPLADQKATIDRMRAALDPPPGVTARIAGLPVLAADAHAALASPWRRLGTLAAGLLLAGLVLALVRRSLRRAWVPLVPVALATGWSALGLAGLGVPLNPMSAMLGALIIAVATEFAVLLEARYAEERAAGRAPAAALRRTYASTGAAVLASGATAIAGFAVLATSDVQMLRELGVATVVDLTASLLGVLAVLPATLMLAERTRGGVLGKSATHGDLVLERA